MIALSLPAARASLTTVFSFSPQPSRTQTGISVPPARGASVPNWTRSFLGSLHLPCASLIPLSPFPHPALISELRLLESEVGSLFSLVWRLRNSRSHSL